MDLFTASSTAQTEKFMLVEAVRRNMFIWLFTFLAETFCRISLSVFDSSEDGMYLLSV